MCYHDMLAVWYGSTVEGNRAALLLQAIRSPAIDHQRLANDLEAKWKKAKYCKLSITYYTWSLSLHRILLAKLFAM